MSLKLRGKTRWGTILYSLESIHKNKGVLQAIAIDESSNLPQAIKKLLLSEKFWKHVEFGIQIFKPIVSDIVALQGDDALIHKMHSMIKSLVTKFKEIIHSSNFFTPAEQKKLVSQLTARTEFTLKNIHAAAAKLNPASLGHELSQSENLNALEFIFNTAKNMELDESQVMADMASYQNKEGAWAKLSSGYLLAKWIH